MPDRKFAAHLALFVVNLIYGINYPIAKSLMPGVVGPSGFILLRVLGAGLLFWACKAVWPQRVDRSDLIRFVLCALTGVAINQLFFFHGLMRTSPINASIIMVATPILVLVLSAVLIGERVTWMKVSGVVAGAAGAITLLLNSDATDTGATLKGDLFILLNATSYALYLVMVKPLMRKYSAITVMSWCFLIGSLVVVPFGFGEVRAVEWVQLDLNAIWKLLFVIIGVTFVAYLLNTWALRHVEPSVVGIYIYMQPVLAVAVTWLAMQLPWLGDGSTGRSLGFGAPQIISSALIFIGVYLVGRADARTGIRS